jgi:ATP-binding cassette, subfamily B, bacterial MsbA
VNAVPSRLLRLARTRWIATRTSGHLLSILPDIRGRVVHAFAPVVAMCRQCGVTRAQITTLLVLTTLGVFCDGVGLSMIYPIGEYLVQGGDMDALLASSQVWQWLHRAFAPLGIEPGVGLISALSAGFLILRQVITYCRVVFQAEFAYGITRDIRYALFERFLSARLSMQERLASGPFANAMTTETVQAPVAVLMPVELLNAASMMTVYLTILMWLSPWATLVVVVVLGLIAFGMRGLVNRVRVLGLAIVAANARYTQHFLQRCRSARLIRLSLSEGAEKDEALALLRSQADNNIRAARVLAITDVGIEPLALITAVPLMVVAVVFYGAELSMVGMFLLVLARLAPMVRAIIRAWQSFVATRASVEATLALLDEMDVCRETSLGVEPVPSPITSIEFDVVTYRYDDSRDDALKGITMHIPGGAMTAIVGPSGSGKSTLTDLIPHLRRPDNGTVRINAVSLDDVALSELRKACGFVSQTPMLMTGTIAEQIGYGRQQVGDLEVRRAAQLANADGFVEALPDGYDTRLGEGGQGLSGGQRQRIELARALASRAPILILDEPTSSVDGESAHLIGQALTRIREETDATIILVGHHLGMLSHCDHIVVLNEGLVADQGSHAALMGREGWYRSTFNRQAVAATAPVDAAAIG